MFKTSKLMNGIHIPTNDSLTPIRDYENDYFHSNDDKLPVFQRVQSQSNRYGNLNPYRHTSNSSNKRPASLDLSGIINGRGESFMRPKKMMTPSPLNVDLFDKIIALNTPQLVKDHHNSKNSKMSHLSDENDELKFFQIIRDLYDSEVEYIEMMQMATCVYRKSLHKNPMFKNKIIKGQSSDEILLFGNIDTITSISKIFLSSLNKMLSANNNKQPQPRKDDEYWDELYKNGQFLEIMYESFNIGDLFEQHLHRIKSTYLNYFVTESKQIQLYDNLKENNSSIFQKWTEYCLKRCQFTKLEDILKRPMSRLEEWINVLNDFKDINGLNSILCDEFIESIDKTQQNYNDFKIEIERQIMEYNGGNNNKYDFSLTPMEIIQSYANTRETQLEPHEEERSLSATSSHYSGDTQLLDQVNDNEQKSTTQGQKGNPILRRNIPLPPMEEPQEDPFEDGRGSLPENIVKFKKIFGDLNKLRNLFCKMDFLSLVDCNITNVKKWVEVVKCEDIIGEPSETQWSNGQPNSKLLLPMSQEYLEELNKIKERITILKLTDFEVGIMIPLNQLLKASCKIRHNLKDLKTLKKDYIIYLKEKKTNVYDVKRDVIGKHYETLQSNIDRDLPIFINLVNQLMKLILINYNKLMMSFFETMAGGNKYIEKDLTASQMSTSSNTIHLDILRRYSDSRHYTKRLVRDQWPFDNDPSASRPIRRLFEL